jgi:DNA polymerase III delta subunit
MIISIKLVSKINICLISGDDSFSKEEYIEEIKSGFDELNKGINYLVFDKENINLLEEELSTYSMLSSKRLILVKVPKSTKKTQEQSEEGDSSDNVGQWYTDSLEEKLLNSSDDDTIVFVEEGTSKGKMHNFFNKNGIVVTFDKEKPAGTQNWLVKYCKDQGFMISNSDASYLLSVCGTDKQNIHNELTKLFNYSENNVIKKEDIEKLCIKTTEAIIFDLTDGIGQKNRKYALQKLDDLIGQKEPIQKILVMITRHFKNLLLTKECINTGKSVEKSLNLKSYPAMKYSSQCKNFSIQELCQIFEKLAKLDVESKTYGADIKIGIQKIIME